MENVLSLALGIFVATWAVGFWVKQENKYLGR